MPSSSPFRPHRGRSLRRLPSPRRSPPARSPCVSACTPGRRFSPTRATSEATSTAPPASPPAATAGRYSSRPRPLSSSKARACRPRRAPAQGSLRARAHLPARRRRLSGAQEPLPHEPAGAGDTLPRPRAGARRGRRASPPRRRSPAHPDRPRRDGEDAPRPAGGRSRLRGLPRRGLVGPARSPARSGARPRDGRRRPLGSKNGLAEHIARQGDALPLRQLRAGGGGGSRAREPSSAPVPTSTCSSRAGSACASRGEQTYPVPPLAESDGEALFLTPRARRRSCLHAERGRARAVRAPRRASRSRSSSPPPAPRSSAPSSCSRSSRSGSTC